MNKDSRLIFETYARTSANKQILQEGLFDRMKARGAQAVGAVKGFGNQAAGAVKGAVAGMKGDTAGVQAAAQQRQAGAIQGELAKIDSYQATATQKLQNLANEIFADLGSLGIDVARVSPNSINTFVGQLNSAFTALKDEVATNASAAAPAPAATPAAPAAAAPTSAAPAPAAPAPAAPAATAAPAAAPAPAKKRTRKP